MARPPDRLCSFPSLIKLPTTNVEKQTKKTIKIQKHTKKNNEKCRNIQKKQKKTIKNTKGKRKIQTKKTQKNGGVDNEEAAYVELHQDSHDLALIGLRIAFSMPHLIILSPTRRYHQHLVISDSFRFKSKSYSLISCLRRRYILRNIFTTSYMDFC